MEYSRVKRVHKIIISQTVIAIVITFIALGLLYYAQGYRLNIKTLKLYRTGIITIDTLPENANIYIDGIKQEKKTPFAKSLPSANYNISAELKGYSSWYKKVEIQPEYVISLSKVVLFKADIEPVEITDNNKIKLVNQTTDFAIRTDEPLTISGGEIWVDKKLVTRFSSPVLHAIWYSDFAHVIYQLKDEVRVIDLDGQNDTLLAKLESETQTRFALGNKGRELYYFDNGIYKEARIR